MRIKSLEITGLFGHFNHKISFVDENITIITAPNGYGKTMCLKIIDAIFNNKFSFFEILDFQKINLTVQDDRKIEIIKSNNQLEVNNGHANFKYERFDGEKQISLAFRIERSLPFLNRVSQTAFTDERTGEQLTLSEVLDNYSELLPEELKKRRGIPTWFTDFSKLLNVYFIRDQRLISKETEKRIAQRSSIVYTETIKKYADELSEKLRRVSIAASRESSRLDGSFPARLLQSRAVDALSAENLAVRFNELQNRRNELATFNLLQTTETVKLTEIEDEDRKVLTLYVNDANKKLDSYNEVLPKIRLFKEIIDSKKLSFKTLKIDPQKGFYFKPISDFDDKELDLSQLSSGEQHQIVLLYELIFKTGRDVLLLIDEPEISLHVAWQKQFLNDWQKITKLQDMKVVVATHSPQIINGQWDLTVELGESEANV
ncbi:AAA family ATPase [Hydromonas duriensis]|uniref:Putative ATP-binding protein involved in virulence n=1 Tax=Hydromonas duriensis TaxID=1527608 RepID=A0A4R6Y6W7_9BURK|nr:AAA family ATPase [Hydromonas duriensis]TDR28988.1 putative ATP-binding protein involved in virulence [Hydromonas duriensis]